jgi:hypothetical protein
LKIGHQDRFYSIDSEYDAAREFLQITLSVGGIENWMFLGKTENSSQRIPDFRSHAATQTMWAQILHLSSKECKIKTQQSSFINPSRSAASSSPQPFSNSPRYQRPIAELRSFVDSTNHSSHEINSASCRSS